MRNRIRQFAVIAGVAALPLTACGRGHNDQANGDVAPPSNAAPVAPSATTSIDTVTPKQHSKLAGAAIGAVVGHELGGHAVAGAAAGALLQHERNKHARP